MKPTLLSILGMTLLLAGHPSFAAEAEDAPASPQNSSRKEASFDDFKSLLGNNIFNPDRRPPRAPTPPPPPPPPPPPSTERIVLKGTIVGPKGTFALFDGTDSSFRKMAEIQAQIGDFKLIETTTSNAVVQLAEEKFTLQVGSELSRQGDSPWKLSQGSGFSSGASASRASAGSSLGSSSSSSSSTTSSSASSSSGEMSEVLKRLMERRKQESQ